jgi:hypothetical protein
MNDNNPNKGKELQIDLPLEVADGVYSNLAVISHSQSEFIIDFINMLPGKPKATVKSRVLLSPQNAKNLLLALQDNLSKFENNFGKISERKQDNHFGFAIPSADA